MHESSLAYTAHFVLTYLKTRRIEERSIPRFRILPDGLASLIRWSGPQLMALAESSPDGRSHDSHRWRDSLVIALDERLTDKRIVHSDLVRSRATT